MVNDIKGTVNEPVYSRFSQVKDVIQGVEAIDYFFAKEMLSALASLTNSETFGSEFDTTANISRQRNLYHLFLALSASLRAGHSCLPLSEVAAQHWGKGFASTKKANNVTQATKDNQQDSEGLTQENAQELSHAGFVFAPLTQLQGMLSELNIQALDQQLLVLQHDKLYLRRYFQFESDLGQAINARLLQQCQYDNDNIRQCIGALFPNEHAQDAELLEIDWQKVAVANAINKNFSVIAGGPGTGKTYTVTKLLAALVMLEQRGLEQQELEQRGLAQKSEQGTPVLNIALVAPTGKAAQRLSESIVNAIAGFKSLIDDKVLAEIPTQAQTLHRLLGVLPNSPNFRHHEDNRLAYDIVLIDEVSMVDLPLMTRVFRALKDTTKVILLGDADQLPSVATGSVLADIAPRPHGGFSLDNEHYLTQVCQLSSAQVNDCFSKHKQAVTSDDSMQSNKQNTQASFDYLTFLVKSRRFDGEGGIGLLANSVIQGDVKSSWQLLNHAMTQVSQKQQASQLTLAQGELSSWLAPLVKQYYQPIESCANVSDAFALLSQFRVLCA
ncbi:MAG: AAA family ATPase, partial [Colwellia sp.]